jgi:hypothetical protein
MDVGLTLERDALARPSESFELLDSRSLLHARECQMWTEWSPIDLEAELFACKFDVVVKQLESWLPFDTHPYDARAPKVRERPDIVQL